MKITCPICKKEFYIRPARLKRQKSVHCSLKCYARDMEGKPGHKMPESAKQKLRLANLGKKHSEALKKKMSEGRKGKYFGSRHHNWHGGFMRGSIKRNCLFCDKTFTARQNSHKYCSHKCYSSALEHPFITYNGYIMIHKPSHPFAGKNGHILEHRLVTESVLKRYLTEKEIVHHIDSNKQNNNPANLYLFPNVGKHLCYHKLVKNHPEITISKSNLF